MNKNVVAVFAAVCGIVMITGCDTPKDQRPETKVSVDTVPPGTRNTHNVGGVNEVHGHGTQHQEVMPNHDEGANTIQPGDSIDETGTTNTEAGAIRR
ncbi:hypothetical protein FVR03_03560 [Pontibacter qinzhouensis]|uniref:Uncharacterized protein n=1 Tax=Pontibacter qinzhouensis TaxID=2603253 RepID=A0A5C8KEN2_9BACT|nr:hypothetical protein [Pontibacter qinzhouensis]TXK51298.1 hypothetical protein FVR03_03560 [Pontibacter qinzhouensis]